MRRVFIPSIFNGKKLVMYDTHEIIHARSERLVKSMHRQGSGEINLDGMLAIIDHEEANANLKPEFNDFWDKLRTLARKAYDGLQSNR